MRTVSALCVTPGSSYEAINGVEAYTPERDAWTFDCSTPIVAHPPCRGWSKNFSKQAKPEPGEMDLGVQCCSWLRQCGGVLEQPRNSKLFRAAGIPHPHEGELGGVRTIEVHQSWFGYPTRKATWLAFAGIDPRSLEIPFILRDARDDGRTFERMSKRQRSHTVPDLARWLVAAARKSTLMRTPCEGTENLA